MPRVGLVHATTVGREKRFRVDQAQLARAAAQLADVGAAWDARLQRIKRIAETIQRGRDTSNETEQKQWRETREWQTSFPTAAPRGPRSPSARATQWATFLMSLKQLPETGEGAPDPCDVRISDWH